MPKPDPVPFDMELMALKKWLFECVFYPPPPSRAFDPIWPIPLDPNILTFEDASLDRAVSCIQKYLELGDVIEWIHVMLRTLTFLSFLEAIDGNEGCTRILPFSYWCDGGQPYKAVLGKHRHMIVVSPQNHFWLHVWRKISSAMRLSTDYRCLDYEPVITAAHFECIKSALHLVNTIGYLCSLENAKTCNHFYCFESLPKDY